MWTTPELRERPDRYVAAHADETSLGAVIDRLRGLLEPGAMRHESKCGQAAVPSLSVQNGRWLL